MADAFQDAQDEFRAARTRDLLTRIWPYAAAVLAALVLAALGAWAWDRFAAAQAARASKTYAEGVAAAQAGRTADARRAFADVAGSGSAAYRSLALMQEAGLALQADKPAEALRQLDQAARTAPDRIVRDAAALKAALIAMDVEPLPAVENRLQPLLGKNRPFRDMAREALATAKLAAGRGGEARRDFSLLVVSPDVSDPTRARARAALAMIDSGAASALPAAVKAEQALAPLPPAPVGASDVFSGAQ